MTEFEPTSTLVEHRIGDLFDQRDVGAIAQGVNCMGRMGAGIAVLFRRRWPLMFMDYANECELGLLVLGGLHAWQDPETGTWVYNLASQHSPGPDARLPAIRHALTVAVRHAESNGVEAIGLPRIGAGIGGLTWSDVLAVYEEVAATTRVRLIAVTHPKDL